MLPPAGCSFYPCFCHPILSALHSLSLFANFFCFSCILLHVPCARFITRDREITAVKAAPGNPPFPLPMSLCRVAAAVSSTRPGQTNEAVNESVSQSLQFDWRHKLCGKLHAIIVSATANRLGLISIWYFDYQRNYSWFLSQIQVIYVGQVQWALAANAQAY